MLGPVEAFPVLRGPGLEQVEDWLAVEEPLEIRVQGTPLVVTMRTPGEDRELAAGFCWSEGILLAPDELEEVRPCTQAAHGNVVDVILADAAYDRWRQIHPSKRRELLVSSSCGICGTQRLEDVTRCTRPLPIPPHVDPVILLTLPERLRAEQSHFARTGGLHAAGLFRPDGSFRVLCEDIGRHNALDKLIGTLLLTGQLPMQDAVLVLSGRISFELVQKAAQAGMSSIAAVGAPSSLAVATARQIGITLYGFIRENRFNLYC
jgi:FdhD protein